MFSGFSLGGCFAFVGSPKFFFLLHGFAKEGFGGEALLLCGLDDVEELFSQRGGIFGGAVRVFERRNQAAFARFADEFFGV